ncbi:VanZ family protein [Rossellomorea sp. NPDC077527]|uniref:VanZ family protein n=1 Tax=Rossellomorea sp. NPDC077527 TaxID=3364510 RepID=UPI0037C7377E
MKVKKQKYLVWLFLTFIFMMVIYFISDMPYEAQDIKPLLESKMEKKFISVPDVKIKYDQQVVSSSSPYEFIEFLYRKAGHILGYFTLTLLWIKTLSYTKLKLAKKLLFSILLSIAYAGMDEFHQTFVPGRTGHLIDVVVVDLMGVVLAVVCVVVIEAFKSKSNTEVRNEV